MQGNNHLLTHQSGSTQELLAVAIAYTKSVQAQSKANSNTERRAEHTILPEAVMLLAIVSCQEKERKKPSS